jgi:hypothetical protein
LVRLHNFLSSQIHRDAEAGFGDSLAGLVQRDVIAALSFDLRGYLPESAVLSQLAEGGLNARDNCVPTSFHIAMIALGYPDVPPQVWTDFEYGPSYYGPEALTSAVDFINRHPEHFPNPPTVSITNAAAQDVLAVIDDAGRQGFPIVGAWWCDCSTVQVVPYPTACGHASPLAAYDGQTWRLWNVWTGFEQTLSDELLRSSYAGGVAVFQRSVFTREAQPAAWPVEEAVLFTSFSVDPGRQSFVPGCHNGPLPSGPRRVLLTLYTDEVEGQGTTASVFLAAPDGSVPGGEQRFSLATDRQQTVDTSATVQGDFTLEVRNTGATVLHCTVSWEKW